MATDIAEATPVRLDDERLWEIERRRWALLPMVDGGWSVVAFTPSGAHQIVHMLSSNVRHAIDTALRAAGGDDDGHR